MSSTNKYTVSNVNLFILIVQHELNYQAIEEAINNTIITCFVKKMPNTHASGSTEKYSAIILHKSLLAEIISQIPSTTGYSEPNPELPSTSIDENVVSTAPKDTNVTSSCLSTLKISESPTKKQRSDKYQKQDWKCHILVFAITYFWSSAGLTFDSWSFPVFCDGQIFYQLLYTCLAFCSLLLKDS